MKTNIFVLMKILRGDWLPSRRKIRPLLISSVKNIRRLKISPPSDFLCHF